MATQQERSGRGVREPGRGMVIDLSEHIPTRDLYVIKWSEAKGQLLAIHGPIGREETPSIDVPRRSWTADHDLEWARAQHWREIEVLAEEGF